jgi:hypothetical protein
MYVPAPYGRYGRNPNLTDRNRYCTVDNEDTIVHLETHSLHFREVLKELLSFPLKKNLPEPVMTNGKSTSICTTIAENQVTFSNSMVPSRKMEDVITKANKVTNTSNKINEKVPPKQGYNQINDMFFLYLGEYNSQYGSLFWGIWSPR